MFGVVIDKSDNNDYLSVIGDSGYFSSIYSKTIVLAVVIGAETFFFLIRLINIYPENSFGLFTIGVFAVLCSSFGAALNFNSGFFACGLSIDRKMVRSNSYYFAATNKLYLHNKFRFLFLK